MSGLKLNNLYIRSFRGIKALDLTLNGNSLVLCGENGTGKSSIVSALEFLFTENIRNLEGQWVNNNNKSVTHILDDKSDLLIDAEFSNKQYFKRTFDSVEKSDDFDDYIEQSFYYASFFLNRRKLLDFVEAGDKERYKELANFFGLKKLDDIEDQFRRTKTSLNNELKSAKNEKQNILERFSKLFNKDFQDSEDILKEFNLVLKENSFDEVDLNTDFEEYKLNFKDLLTHSKINDLIEKINFKFENIKVPSEEYGSLIDDYNKNSLNTLKSSNNLLAILKESKKYLEDNYTETCPVCKNPIDSDIFQSLDKDIERFTDDINQFDQWNIELKEFNENLNDLENTLGSIDNNILEINKLILSLNQQQINLNNEFLSFKNSINLLKIDLSKLAKFEKSIIDFDMDYMENIKSDIVSLEKEFDNFSKNLKIKKTDENIELISSSINYLSFYQQSEKRIIELEKQIKIAEKTYNLFTESKIKYVEELVREIETDVINFYQFIHIDDEIRNPKLIVSKAKGVKLEIDFYDKSGINPRSFSSEGHLDTLGICLFLAIAKRLSKTPIIVLDDIIATVDMAHKDRVAMLLFEEFYDYQIFITTHNKLWYEQLKRFENEYRSKKSNKFDFAEIIDWSLMDGPIFTKYKSDKQIIYHHLDSEYVDLHAAANGARRYLEFILYKFAILHGVKITFKNEYTLNNYLPAVQDEVLSLTEKTVLHDYYERLFLDLRATKFSSNKLSHYDDRNKYFSYDEVNRFVELVFKLEYALFYLKGYKKLTFKRGSETVVFDKENKISMEEFIFKVNEKCINENKQRKKTKSLD